MGSEAESEACAHDPVKDLLIVGLSVQSQGARAGLGGLMVEVVDASHSRGSFYVEFFCNGGAGYRASKALRTWFVHCIPTRATPQPINASPALFRPGATIVIDLQLSSTCLTRACDDHIFQALHPSYGRSNSHNITSASQLPPTFQNGKPPPPSSQSSTHPKTNTPIPKPAKRKPPTSKPSSSTTDVPRPRASKLAKEHNISAHEEREIREAFSLFAEPLKGYSKEGVIPTSDVRSCLVALGIPPSSRDEQAEFVEILDPEGEGFVAYEPFFAVCALKYHQREERGGGEARRREVEEAFGLFTGAGAGGGGSSASGSAGPRDVITIADLKRVAAVLREDVKDEVLRDMILEANGGAGVGKGVRRDEFEEVMRRAGVWR
ncbi:calmodulin [Colletotrichum simmondsii]|uniref:Calmodulin n=1 Tax=Colletotrichum simmondsii TaxID=703756 RepID=A0A135RWN9_9PEZI|nr:calmodulin [Colletotrichum simmondsii]